MLCIVTGVAKADPVSGEEDVPATSAEIHFIDQVVDKVKEAVAPLEGWNLDIGVTASGNTVRAGKPVLIYSRARSFPLKINLQFTFSSITETVEKRAEMEKSAQELQQEAMAAAQSGDMQKMQQIQQQLAAMLQGQMSAAMNSAAPPEKPTRFFVQVVVNGDGETIGNQYDIAVPGVTKAFKLDKGAEKSLSYKYYLGAWEVSPFDKRNWRIASPKADQTAANHLKVLVATVSVHGDRDGVESYVSGTLDLRKVKELLN